VANGQSASEAEESIFDCSPPLVLKKGEIDRIFLISRRSQHEVARGLTWKCGLLICGGSTLALISLYFFLLVKGLL